MTTSNATCNAFDPVYDGPADDPTNYCNDCGAVAAAHSKPAAATHHCPTCDSTAFDVDHEFVDETGYVCPDCGSNVFYGDHDGNDPELADMVDEDETREIASDWHGGQSSPLYALASSGSVVDGLADEIRENLEMLPASAQYTDEEMEREGERLSRLLAWATRYHFHAGHNDAGYMPEADVATFASFAEARDSLADELRQAAESMATWAEPHDCDDVPCPTFGDDCPDHHAGQAELLAEELGEASGPEWQAYLSDGRALPVSWWISPCAEADCAPEEDDEDDEASDFWALLESPPVGRGEVAALWSWSLNYDAGTGPATLFLDLIGHSQDEYGQALYSLDTASLGYRELEYLRDALSEYLSDPHGVRGFVATLLEAEGSR